MSHTFNSTSIAGIYDQRQSQKMNKKQLDKNTGWWNYLPEDIGRCQIAMFSIELGLNRLEANGTVEYNN